MQDDKKRTLIADHLRSGAQRGQALVEYALLLVLVAIAFGVGLAATGPVVTNVFNNTVFSLVNGPTADPAVDREVLPDTFWVTVTAVAALPELEQPLPTRTQAPPTVTPSPGPSPTPSPVTPTATRAPTETPPPEPTEADLGFLAPHVENVNEPEHWRVGVEPFLGWDNWTAYFYPSRVPDPGTHSFVREMDTINENWGNVGPQDNAGGAWPAGDPGNNFSVSFIKTFWIEEDMTINFQASANDGVRIWVYGNSFGASPFTCSSTGVTPTTPDTAGNQANNFYGDPSTDCLIMNDWHNGGSNGGNVTRTIPGGTAELYTLRVDMYQATGSSSISFNTSVSSNEDDTYVDNSGSPQPTGDFACNWGRDDNNNDANSLDFMWEDYIGDDFAVNSRCHLEFRGFVYVPEDAEAGQTLFNEVAEVMPNPVLEFWDVWDFDSTATTAWLEIAEYIEDPAQPVPPDRYALDRGATWSVSNPTFVRVNLNRGATTNYNWTNHRIDLTTVNGGTLKGKRVTFRFVMQNTTNNNNDRRWFIDDIGIVNNDAWLAGITTGAGDIPTGTFFGMDVSPLDPARDVRDDFITTGLWQIGNNNIGSSPDAWALSNQYSDFSDNPPNRNNWDWNDQRNHAVMINGVFRNPEAGVPDAEGDTGPPVLTFTHRVGVRRYTGIEVQYRDASIPFVEGEAGLNEEWFPIPGVDPSDPPGVIRSITLNNDNDRNIQDVRFEEIELGLIPVDRYYLRFVMRVNDDFYGGDGWVIDDIHFHRLDPPRYTDYEFFDDFESGVDAWRVTSGDWARTTDTAYSITHSMTDSPDGNYSTRTQPSFRLLNPIDFNDDTPPTDGNDTVASDGTLLPANTAGAAVNPIMSFWHWRDLDRNDDFYVEWRRLNDADDQWQTLWVYEYGMRTASSGSDASTAVQKAWEYIELDLEPLIRGTAGGDTLDDDILIRFRMDSDGGNTNDGLYIDDVFIGENEQSTVRLWPESEDPTIGGDNFGTGTGNTYLADLEGADWEDEWIIGGDWTSVDWTNGRRQGLLGFHDSSDGQTEAIYGRNDGPIDNVRGDTYHVLEMNQIFDMRATSASEAPTLYFWSRFYVGRRDTVRVQVSRELGQTPEQIDTNMEARCGTGRLQCYEQERGWSEWETVWERTENTRMYTWRRFQVPLDRFASQDSNTPGDRIRIRFVHDALRDNSNRDGWYLDWVTIERLRDDIKFDIGAGNFFDRASNLNNWVTEGIWGLSPQLYRNTSGGPATLGVWRERWWDCREDRNNDGVFNDNCNDSRGDSRRLLNDNPDNNNPPPDAERTVLNVNYDLRRGAPIPGTFDETDSFYGRWVLETPTIGTGGVQAGDYTFITITDDGVRMKAEYFDGSQWVNVNCELACDGNQNNADEWFMINDWNYQGRSGNVGNVTLDAGLRYRIILEYFEGGGDAVMILNTGGNSFSFTDSPVPFAGADDIPSSPYGNSALLFDGTLDLSGTTLPILAYYTLTELGGDDANVEVSVDGGFEWSRDGFNDDQVSPAGFVDNDFDSGRYGGNQGWTSGQPTWTRKRHNLETYAGFPIMIRFRLDYNEDTRNKWGGNDYFVSWWVTEIFVGDAAN